MKKLLLLLALMIFATSCKESKTDFIDITGLSLGADFNKLPIAKLFIKIREDEYKIRRHDLSDEIGSVSSLTVKTENGKIFMVRFGTNDETNVDALNRSLKKIMRNPVDINLTKPATVYQTASNNVLVVMEDNVTMSRSKKQLYDYMYLIQKKSVKSSIN
jgi:hypothetical protein